MLNIWTLDNYKLNRIKNELKEKKKHKMVVRYFQRSLSVLK